MQTIDILYRARALYAAAPSHAPVGQNPKPGTVCIIFALGQASLLTTRFSHPANQALYAAVGAPGLADWNAEHSTAEVLDAFDRAIAAEAAKQGLRVPALARIQGGTRNHVHPSA